MTISVIIHILLGRVGAESSSRGAQKSFQGFINVSQVLSGTFQTWKPVSAGAGTCGIEVETRSPTSLTFAWPRSRVQTQALPMSNY